MRTLKTLDRKVINGLEFLAGKILWICEKTEGISGKTPEVAATALYAAAHLLMAVFHEPWYDEAVAWQIARCASVWDILFRIPHYEGHPPLWHLILMPFAKLGAPYELSLSIVSLVFAGAAVGLIIWRSPFPRILRLLVPFTYFFFYQYGVISRPYCVMMLAFALLAMAWPRRNQRPGRYTLSLMLLCLTSAYGIVIAGGLAAVWVWEIRDGRKIGVWVKSFPTDRRIRWLLGLLVLALCLVGMIMPKADTYATNPLPGETVRNELPLRLAYMLLFAPTDVLFTSVYSGYGFLEDVLLMPSAMLAALPAGIVFWAAAFLWGRRKRMFRVLLVPYLLFAGFSSVVYLCAHHVGLALLLILFWLWVSLEAPAGAEGSVWNQSIVRSGSVLIGTIVIAISLGWNISACLLDVQGNYASGRNEAAFISEYGLDKCRIMVGWDVNYDAQGNVLSYDLNHTRADNVAPYFAHNLFFNFNDGKDELNYSTHRQLNGAEAEARFAQWAEEAPDVLFMNPELGLIYDEEELSMADYTLVYSRISHLIWKGNPSYSRANIHVRNDLLEELGLEEVEPDYPH